MLLQQLLRISQTCKFEHNILLGSKHIWSKFSKSDHQDKHLLKFRNSLKNMLFFSKTIAHEFTSGSFKSVLPEHIDGFSSGGIYD